MKSKILLCCFCVCGYFALFEACHAAPGSVYRDYEAHNNSNYTPYKPSYLYKASEQQNYTETDSDSDVRFVMEYQVNLFTSAKSTLSLSNGYVKASGKSKSTDLNNGGMLLLGVAFSELNAQINLMAGRIEQNDEETTNIGVGLRLPMTKGTLQPYMEVSAFYSTIDLDWVDDVSAIGFGVEGGLLYNLTRNTYIRAGVAYGYTKFKEEESGIKGTLKNTSWTFNTGLGYRF
ncbi:MAG: outer membrane beta-barrel protein [Candidatus Enterousia sp.]